MSIHYLFEQFFAWITTFPPNIILITIISILFIGSIFESIPFIGMFFPTETLTVLIGVFAYKYNIDIILLIAVTFLGLFLGDLIGYKIGKKLGKDFLMINAKKLKINEQRYNSIHQSLDNNFLKVLLFARSNGFTRWIVPFVAGANEISYSKFTIANVFTALFWAPTFLLGGYLLGNAFEKYGKYFGLGILFSVVISFLFYKIYKHFEKIGLLQRDDFKYFLINVLGIFLFSKMLEDTLDLEFIVKIDMWINLNISSMYTPFLTKVMIFITSIGNPVPYTFVLVILFGLLIYKKYFKDLLFFTITLVGSSFLVFLIKYVIAKPRPELKVIDALGYSFPSAHATISITIAFTLYIIFKNKVLYKRTFLLLSMLIPILISFSRVYLNVHYLSDIIAALGLALFWVSLVAIVFDIYEKRISRGQLNA